MPLITFEIGKISDEMKSELIHKITDLSADITGIPKDKFFFSLREMPDDNVAVGGKTVREIKKELGLT